MSRERTGIDVQALGLGRDVAIERLRQTLAGQLRPADELGRADDVQRLRPGIGLSADAMLRIRPIPFFARARDHRGEFLPRPFAVVADGLAQQQDAGIAVATRHPVGDQAQLACVAGARRMGGRDQRLFVDAFTKLAAAISRPSFGCSSFAVGNAAASRATP